MAHNVSAVSTKIQINGIGTISDFADDQSPFEVEPIDIGGSGMNICGDLVYWQKSNPIQLKISVIPESVSDSKLYQAFNRHKVRHNEVGQLDDKGYTINITQTQGARQKYARTYNCAFPMNMPFISVSNDGRHTGKTYTFVCEDNV